MVVARCGLPALTLARHREARLADLVLSREARAELARRGVHATMQPALLGRDQRIAYRALIHRPIAELDRGELERIQALRTIGRIEDPLAPGTATHKAQRWADYKARRGEWSFERWSVGYDQNVTRPNESRAVTDAYWRELGWGEREVRVEVEKGSGMWRVLDIADEPGKRAVEVKSGYVSYTAEVGKQAERDAILVQDDWSITWHVEGRCSDSVRKALRNARITLEETHPDMPVAEVRKLYRRKP